MKTVTFNVRYKINDTKILMNRKDFIGPHKKKGITFKLYT